MSRSIFDALASLETTIAAQIVTGENVIVPLNLTAETAKELLKHIQKFNQATA